MKKTKRKLHLQNSHHLWQWAGLAVALLLAAVCRLHLLQIPLERDEGEFAYMGQLILHGIPPYLLAFNMKLPGIYYAYAALMGVFGTTTGAIHFGLLLVNFATIVMVFFMAKRLFGPWLRLQRVSAMRCFPCVRR